MDIKDKIIKNLLELYFLRTDGLMCDFHTWLAGEGLNHPLHNTSHEDLLNDNKFEQLLNLKSDLKRSLTPERDSNSPPPEKKLRVESHAGKDGAKSNETHHREPDKSRLDRVIEQTCPTSSKKESPTRSSKVAETIVTPTPVSDENQHQSVEQIKFESAVTRDTRSKQGNETHHSDPETSRPDRVNEHIPPTSSKKESPTRTSTVVDLTDTPTPVCAEDQPQTVERVKHELSSTRDTRSKQGNETHHSEPDTSRSDRVNEQTSPTNSKKESPTRISKVVEQIVTPTAANAESQQRQIVERAKHEAAVTSRIAELRKQGLWTARRLPKLQDPPRPKTHWDYLLEEMKWLATDFATERNWKRKSAKKCASMVYRYHQEKRSKIERAEREHLQHIKKMAASQAKEVRSFWSTIEKIVDFRQQTKLEETRKKAWGLHLNYILDQTSKFSNTFLDDSAQSAKAIESEDYLMSQDGENAEKEPVINVSNSFCNPAIVHQYDTSSYP